MSNKTKITVTVDTDLLKKAKDKTGIADNDALLQEGIRELLRTQIRRNTLSMEGMGWGWDDESDLERKTTPNEDTIKQARTTPENYYPGAKHVD